MRILFTVVLAWFVFGTDGAESRKPGTLLLNMLVKNERTHLARTLPKWAPIIDYWIIGVDDNNTDDSLDIIKKELGHIPGEVVTVHFDGMGPTWTVLVKEGLKKFPEATHGIIADADFAPMSSKLDKYQLDVRCSKHMYTVWSPGRHNQRRLDWIYRNIEGARVERRTHQSVLVPEMENQEVFQTLVDLEIEEQTGGYQDRTAGKSERYMRWLFKDLEEMPGDARTLYYLGYAFLDQFTTKENPQKEDLNLLRDAVKYFEQRAATKTGYYEERWFAMLKVGEINERWLGNFEEARVYYKRATELDPERADAWFYLGQLYRLRGDVETAFPLLHTAVSVAYPPRSLFQWQSLYSCLRHVELARCAAAMTSIPSNSTALVMEAVEKAQKGCQPDTASEIASLAPKIKTLTQAGSANVTQAKTVAKSFASWASKDLVSVLNLLSASMKKDLSSLIADIGFVAKKKKFSCERYLSVAQPYLSFFDKNLSEIQRTCSKAREWSDWLVFNLRLWALCRS